MARSDADLDMAVDDEDEDQLAPPFVLAQDVQPERIVDAGGLVNDHHRGIDLPVGRSRWRPRPFGSAIVIEAVERQTFSFNHAAGGSTTVELARNIDCSTWKYATATLIVHNETGFSAAVATLQLDVKNAAIDPDDPSKLFTAAAVLTSATYDRTNPAPTMRLAGFAFARMGTMLALFMTLSQVNAGAVTATISVRIVGRDA